MKTHHRHLPIYAGQQECGLNRTVAISGARQILRRAGPEDGGMSSHTMTMRETAAAKWAAAKPIVIGVAVGLIAGPIISGVTGFQIRTSTAQAAARAGIVEQQATFCAERARAAVPSAATLGWQERSELARKWAVMPGSTVVDSDVVYACSGKLSS
jgi:hypothetical protein